MLKRLLACVVCAAMMLSFAACSGDEKEKTVETANVKGDKSADNKKGETPAENTQNGKASNSNEADKGENPVGITPIEPVKVPDARINFEPVAPGDLDIDVGSVGSGDASKFESLTEEELAKVKEQYAQVINDIKASFESAGFEIKINRATGEVDVDASILFATDKHEVTDTGKNYLKDFLKAYVPVITKHSDFIANVMVEGHTDTDGKYDYNMELSKKRAENVLSFCKSDKSGLDKNSLSTVKSKFKAVGRSYDNPIYTNGKEDKAASRRVSFRMLINI